MSVALKNISKLILAILLVIPAGLVAIFVTLDISEGVGKNLGDPLDLILPFCILALYVISEISTVRILFEKRFKKIGTWILLGCIFALASFMFPPHNYLCHGADSSSESYQTRGWPIGMIRTGDTEIKCNRGLFDVTMNVIFWYSVSSIIPVFTIKRKKHDETPLTTQ